MMRGSIPPLDQCSIFLLPVKAVVHQTDDPILFNKVDKNFHRFLIPQDQSNPQVSPGGRDLFPTDVYLANGVRRKDKGLQLIEPRPNLRMHDSLAQLPPLVETFLYICQPERTTRKNPVHLLRNLL